MRPSVALLLWFILWPTSTRSQEFDEQFDHWPVKLKIDGKIVISDQLSDFSLLQDVLEQSEREARLLLLSEEEQPAIAEKYAELFDDVVVARPASVTAEDCEQATVVAWHDNRAATDLPGEEQQQLSQLIAGHVAAGKTAIAIGPACPLLAEILITSQGDHPQVAAGWGCLPDCVLATGYTGAPTAKGRLLSVLASHPRTVGIGLAADTLLVLGGRKMRVVGQGGATFMLMANERQPVRMQTIVAQQSPRESPTQWLIDLTEWRRDAIDRTLEPFPADKPPIPMVENGTLVIVGGGGMPDSLMEQFVELAGGLDDARLVYVPCAEQDDVPAQQRMVASWRKMGVKQATFIHTKDRLQANHDQEFLEPLRDATGIWFGGGRQWNFADSYYGTTAHKLMKDVLRRGGVIGGSSAGASVQARYLARATPIENFRIMAPGYERGGLGFIGGVAIDQHFSQRGRHGDMTELVNRYPQLLGIGIDESTALIVKRSTARVVGQGKVHFYDRTQPVYPDQPDYLALAADQEYDMAHRQVVVAEPTEPAE